MKDLKTVLYETIHRNKKSVQQLADETAISSSYLYRAGMPMDQSGVRFPVDFVIPLMKAANDYSILQHIARACDFILVRIPKISSSKLDRENIVSDYQLKTASASNALVKFFSQPSLDNYHNTINTLHAVLECTASTKKYIEKEATGQFDLLFND